MSKPQNILNKFRTYSYYQILVACDGSSTASALGNSTQVSNFQHENHAVQSIGGGKYVVLINDAIDAEYSITSAKWSTVMYPSTTITGAHKFSTLETDGELTITEVQGMRFLGLITQASIDLGVDHNSISFLLKTIFVGYEGTDPSATDVIATTKPLVFMMYDVGAVVDITGSVYTLAFVGANNGAGKLPQASRVANGYSFPLEKNMTLVQAMGLLEAKIAEYYQTMRTNLEENSNTSVQDMLFFYHDVTYRIDLHKDFHGYMAGTNTTCTAASTGYNDSIISCGKNGTVEDLIDEVMKSSVDVVTNTKGKKPGSKQTYIITSSIETEPGSYTIVYHVDKNEIARAVPGEGALGDMSKPSFTPGAGESLEFDYIYTGKNIDIKNMDIKMNFGMTFFQTLGSSGVGLAPVGKNGKIHATDSTSALFATGLSKPLFLGSTFDDITSQNKRMVTSTQTYNSLLSRHAAYENLDTKLVIHGNPQLLGESTPSDSETSTGTEKVDIVEDAQHSITNISKVPGYIKVNIMMPSKAGDSYSEKFWYDGWYYLHSITNIFQDGEFTQELEAMSVPVNEGQSDTTEGDNKEENTVDGGSDLDKGDGDKKTTPVPAKEDPPSQADHTKGTIADLAVTRASQNNWKGCGK